MTKKQQYFSMLWLRLMHKLRQTVVEIDWSLEDGSRVQLPIELGRQAPDDFLQSSTDRI